MHIKKLSDRGDTIVEVLISIGVISLILGAAFVMTNRSLQGTRQSQERVNAVKLVESQIERIKYFAATDSDAIFNPPTSPFCISNTNTVVDAANAACAVSTDGAPTTQDPVFHLSISRSGNVFTVINRWDNVRGAQDKLEMKYKVYE